jgi:hypothetical protein
VVPDEEGGHWDCRRPPRYHCRRRGRRCGRHAAQFSLFQERRQLDWSGTGSPECQRGRQHRVHVQFCLTVPFPGCPSPRPVAGSGATSFNYRPSRCCMRFVSLGIMLRCSFWLPPQTRTVPTTQSGLGPCFFWPISCHKCNICLPTLWRTICLYYLDFYPSTACNCRNSLV